MQFWKYSSAACIIFLCSAVLAEQSPADPNFRAGPGVVGRPTPPEVDRDMRNRCQQDMRDMMMSVDASLRAVQLAQKQQDISATRAALADAEASLKKVQRHHEMCGGRMRRMQAGANRGVPGQPETQRDTGSGTGRAIGRALGEGPSVENSR